MTDCTKRRFAFIEEWEPGIKVEVIMTGNIGEEQLQAIEGFVARQRRRGMLTGNEIIALVNDGGRNDAL